jgi:hypothetical protein
MTPPRNSNAVRDIANVLHPYTDARKHEAQGPLVIDRGEGIHVYDTDGKEFLLGHGGKSNIVRLNDRPVISNETLKSGDVIRIGETVLRFVSLCDESFNWADGATGEGEDVAIA